jgi:arylsulfatase A-like enzyme
MARKPNLIIFLPDQQRADTIGNPKVHAPNLTKLASESIVFERAYVTHPVCTPSRSALMTGLWPHMNGCTRNGVALNEKFRVLPELLGDDDYHTAYLGKWHLGPDGFPQRGFDEWISTEGASPYNEFLIAHGQRPDKPDGGFSKRAVSHLPLELSKPKFLETHACAFIKKHRNDPFLLVVAFVEPHSPYNGPLNDEHPLDEIDVDLTATEPPNDDVPLRYRLMREWQEEEAALDRKRHPIQYFFGSTPEEYRSIKQRYLGLVTMVDLSIGGILACLENVGLADDTVIVHTSDHGDMLGAHRLFGKEVMFEETVRVPLLIRLLGQRQRRMIRQPVSHIDFMPTLLDLLGKTKPVECPGKSLLPIGRGETVPSQNVFMEWAPNRIKTRKKTSLAPRREIKRAVEESTRTVVSAAGWKLCLRDKDLNELYNLNEDPRETCNLFSRERYAAVTARLTDDIHRWQESVNDPLKL